MQLAHIVAFHRVRTLQTCVAVNNSNNACKTNNCFNSLAKAANLLVEVIRFIRFPNVNLVLTRENISLVSLPHPKERLYVNKFNFIVYQPQRPILQIYSRSYQHQQQSIQRMYQLFKPKLLINQRKVFHPICPHNLHHVTNVELR